jgi:oxygen-dependent protoporphyrinogen oxidase
VALLNEALAALVHTEIRDLLQLKAAPAFSHVQIYRRALPQYNLGHAARLAAIDTLRMSTSTAGQLSFVGNYLRGPAIGSCVEQGLAVAAATHPLY